MSSAPPLPTFHGRIGALYVEEKDVNRVPTESLDLESARALLARYREALDALVAAKSSRPDPNYDLIMDPQLAQNIYPKAKLEAMRAADHTCLAAQFCTQELWDKYKDKVSSGPAKWTLARAINSGTLYPESFVGCHAGDAESWDDFSDFFYPVIEAYHRGFSVSTAKAVEGTLSERMDPAKISFNLSASAHDKIVSTRMRIARNLSMFPLNPGGTKETRSEICTLMSQVYEGIQDPELRGTCKFFF